MNSNGLPSLDANSIWNKLTGEINIPEVFKETMRAQFTKDFAEWLSTENVAASDSIKISAKAAFQIISDFARIATDLTKQVKLQTAQDISRHSHTPTLASEPGNPNHLSGNTTLVFPPTIGPSSQLVMPTHVLYSPTWPLWLYCL